MGQEPLESDHRVLSYNRELEPTGYERIENITGDDVVVGGGSPSHGRCTAPQACYVREIKDGSRKDGVGRRKSERHAWKVTFRLSKYAA